MTRIRDPYSTASDCEDNESQTNEFVSDIPIVTIKLTPEEPKDSQKVVVHYKSSTDTSSESSDNSSKSSKSCDSIKLNETKIQKSSTVIEIRKTDKIDSIENQISKIRANLVENKDQNENSVGIRDNEKEFLSDFEGESVDCLQERLVSIHPFPKEDNNMTFKSINSKDVSLRDSGFSELSTRPDSPYENVKPINSSIENIEKDLTEKQLISKVNDIDSLLNGNDGQTFDELERKFQTINKFPVQYYRDEAREQYAMAERRCNALHGEFEETRQMLEQADRARRSTEAELSELHEANNELLNEQSVRSESQPDGSVALTLDSTQPEDSDKYTLVWSSKIIEQCGITEETGHFRKITREC